MSVWGRLTVCWGIHSLIHLLIEKCRNCEQIKMGEQLSLWTGWPKKKKDKQSVWRPRKQGDEGMEEPVWGRLKFFGASGSTSLAPHTWKVLGTSWNHLQLKWSEAYGCPCTSVSLLRQWDERDQADVWPEGVIHALAGGDGQSSRGVSLRHTAGRHVLGMVEKEGQWNSGDRRKWNRIWGRQTTKESIQERMARKQLLSRQTVLQKAKTEFLYGLAIPL